MNDTCILCGARLYLGHCDVCDQRKEEERARRRQEVLLQDNLAAAEGAARAAADQAAEEGGCEVCGQRFLERTRRRPETGKAWCGILGRFSAKGVCPRCYFERCDRGEETEWTEQQWRVHFLERIDGLQSDEEAQRLIAEIREKSITDLSDQIDAARAALARRNEEERREQLRQEKQLADERAQKASEVRALEEAVLDAMVQYAQQAAEQNARNGMRLTELEVRERIKFAEPFQYSYLEDEFTPARDRLARRYADEQRLPAAGAADFPSWLFFKVSNWRHGSETCGWSELGNQLEQRLGERGIHVYYWHYQRSSFSSSDLTLKLDGGLLIEELAERAELERKKSEQEDRLRRERSEQEEGLRREEYRRARLRAHEEAARQEAADRELRKDEYRKAAAAGGDVFARLRAVRKREGVCVICGDPAPQSFFGRLFGAPLCADCKASE